MVLQHTIDHHHILPAWSVLLCFSKPTACWQRRVIALAYKQLPAEPSAAEMRSMARSEAESGLTFAGFAIFQCPLKPESEPALRMLRDSNHQVLVRSELKQQSLQLVVARWPV